MCGKLLKTTKNDDAPSKARSAGVLFQCTQGWPPPSSTPVPHHFYACYRPVPLKFRACYRPVPHQFHASSAPVTRQFTQVYSRIHAKSYVRTDTSQYLSLQRAKPLAKPIQPRGSVIILFFFGRDRSDSLALPRHEPT